MTHSLIQVKWNRDFKLKQIHFFANPTDSQDPCHRLSFTYYQNCIWDLTVETIGSNIISAHTESCMHQRFVLQGNYAVTSINCAAMSLFHLANFITFLLLRLCIWCLYRKKGFGAKDIWYLVESFFRVHKGFITNRLETFLALIHEIIFAAPKGFMVTVSQESFLGSQKHKHRR